MDKRHLVLPKSEAESHADALRQFERVVEIGPGMVNNPLFSEIRQMMATANIPLRNMNTQAEALCTSLITDFLQQDFEARSANIENVIQKMQHFRDELALILQLFQPEGEGGQTRPEQKVVIGHQRLPGNWLDTQKEFKSTLIDALLDGPRDLVDVPVRTHSIDFSSPLLINGVSGVGDDCTRYGRAAAYVCSAHDTRVVVAYRDYEEPAVGKEDPWNYMSLKQLQEYNPHLRVSVAPGARTQGRVQRWFKKFLSIYYGTPRENAAADRELAQIPDEPPEGIFVK